MGEYGQTDRHMLHFTCLFSVQVSCTDMTALVYYMYCVVV